MGWLRIYWWWVDNFEDDDIDGDGIDNFDTDIDGDNVLNLKMMT